MPATNTSRLEGLTASVAVKAPCRVATTAAITLSGLQTIDGIVLAANDRVLVKDQADTTQNGIYLAQSTAWTRALDFDGTHDVVDGTYVSVRVGTVGANTYWRALGTDPIIPGTSAITWTTTAPVAGPKGDPGDDGDPGTPGTAGADGRTILSGAGAPGAGLGSNGDFYINTSAFTIYGPKTAGAWGGATSLIGPTGLSGSGTGDMLAAQNLNDLANKATARTNLGVAPGVDVQAYDADLTTWAGLTPSANAQSLVTAANYAAIRTLLALVVGTNVQAWDADLDTWATVTPSANGKSLVAAANYSAMRTLLTLVPGTDVQAFSAVLANVAASTFDAALKPTESLIIACSDETTALTTGTAKITFRMPYAFTLTGIRASLSTAQTSGSAVTVDVNDSGTTIMTTNKLVFDNTEKTTTTYSGTAAALTDTALGDDAEITVDIDTIGDGTAKGLKVTLLGHR